MVSKGKLEAVLAQEFVQFQKEMIGKGPQDIKVSIVKDMIIIRTYGVFSPAEQVLAEDKENELFLKSMNVRLIKHLSDKIKKKIVDIVGVEVEELFVDTSIKTNQRISVLTLKENIEDKFI